MTVSERSTELSTLAPWRRSFLRRAGCDPHLAAEVAADLRYDVEAMVDLIERGCPPQLAVRILAPLEAE
jgi:hypothetical protein